MIEERAPALTVEELHKLAVPGASFLHVSNRGYERFVVIGKVTDAGRVPVEWVSFEGKYYSASLLGVALVPRDMGRAKRKYARRLVEDTPGFRDLLTPGALVDHRAALFYPMVVCEAPAPGDDLVLVEWFTRYGEHQRMPVRVASIMAVEVLLDAPETVKG